MKANVARLLLLSGSILLAGGCYAPQAYEPPPDGAVPPPPPAEASVSAELPPELAPFAGLDAYGRWFDDGSYGWVWMPTTVRSDWRPYEYGSWIWTDAGWYWQSDEPWGWATCHYGRWVYDGEYGWLWLPDTTWGPAWVEFREGGGFVGWCPLGPGVMPGYAFDGWDGGWVFVDDDDFTNEHVYAHAIPPARNAWMLGRTQVDGGVSTWHDGAGGRGGREIAVPRGPDPVAISHGQPMTPRHVVAAARPGAAAIVDGTSVTTVRPPIDREIPTNRVPPGPGAVRMDQPPRDGQQRPEVVPAHEAPKPIPPEQRGVRHAPPISKPVAPPPPRTSQAQPKHKHG